MKLQVRHKTTYRFDPPTRSMVQSLRLTPSAFEGQQINAWDITCDAGDCPVETGSSFTEGAGDHIMTVSVRGEVTEFTVTVTGEVETSDCSGVVKGLRDKVPPLAYLRQTTASWPNAVLKDLARDTLIDLGTAGVLQQAHALSKATSDALDFLPGETEASTSAAEAIGIGKGVCQDFTHVLIGMARASDIPARYVTGYLLSGSDGSAHEASHAWAELYVAGLGWVGFDAANECCPDERYIRLGSGFDAIDAAPIRGISVGEVDQEMLEELLVDVAVTQMQQ
ncbi:Transglutaminase-like superfamily protein [Aquimixticola soesokkakensis]|uniref:Transglutaminase-like superfamily protein n=1 Tax=Aquimixticola soesokkakensis TaxID=1519096 RepID=A0A1Y5SA24_9RHOB|nr:transglutaminase family protein [Aquimixticola soesokkakensis]SLN36013.1 Transglutaminase-like superfamily protein [Aquimixticola soesokkakensis]